MLEKDILEKYDETPIYGYLPKERTKFCDQELFGEGLWKYVILRKIKLWYGSPKSGDEKLKDKCVLGIQCVYQDLKTGNIKTTEQYCGELSADDIEVKELELKNNDYFNKFNIDYDCVIYHLKFTTRKGELIEVGNETEFTKKTVLMNDLDDVMIHSFVGCYNTYGLRTLGCKYIKRKDFIYIHFLGFLRLRHLFIINDEERKKWEDPKELSKLSIEMKAIAKLCNFPDENFISVLKYLI